MHMADALISPAVGGVMWGASATALVYSGRRVRATLDDDKVPLMGVTGAFVFAAQMLNFTIPGTGSSGHLIGALLLAVLLGPHAAFLVMASILTVQALFFADGGLLALGCNIFNMAFLTVFVAYPLAYRPIVRARPATKGRIIAGSMAAAVVGLQLGALAVVVETALSGVSELPVATFLWLMLPIHLAIGAVEGLATAVVLLFVLRVQPDLVRPAPAEARDGRRRLKPVLVSLAAAAVLCAGLFSWFASSHPDGLEWSVAGASGAAGGLENGSRTHEAAAGLQDATAVFPDYQPRRAAGADGGSGTSEQSGRTGVRLRTSVAGVAGVSIVLALAAVIGLMVRRRVRPATQADSRS